MFYMYIWFICMYIANLYRLHKFHICIVYTAVSSTSESYVTYYIYNVHVFFKRYICMLLTSLNLTIYTYLHMWDVYIHDVYYISCGQNLKHFPQISILHFIARNFPTRGRKKMAKDIKGNHMREKITLFWKLFISTCRT